MICPKRLQRYEGHKGPSWQSTLVSCDSTDNRSAALSPHCKAAQLLILPDLEVKNCQANTSAVDKNDA